MGFKLAEAFVEFKTKNFTTVNSKIDQATRGFTGAGGAAGRFADAVDQINGSGVNRLNQALEQTRSAQRGLAGIPIKTAAVTTGFRGATAAVRGFVASLGPIAGVFAVAELARQTISAGAAAETAQAKLTALMGSATEASSLIGKATEFSASTPFAKQDILDGATALKGAGIETDAVIPKLRQLGNISSLSKASLKDMTEIFLKIRGQGKLTAETLEQLTTRLIPMPDILAKSMKVDTTKVRELISAGKVGINEFQAALDTMTTAGGRYASGIDTLSRTSAGKFSTLKDNIVLVFESVGNVILPPLKAAMDAVTPIIQGVSVPLSSVAQALTGTVSTAISSFTTALAPVGDAFSSAFSTAPSLLVPVNRLLSATNEAAGKLAQAVSGGLTTAFSGIGQAIDSFTQWITGGRTATSLLSTAVTGLGDGLNFAADAIDIVSNNFGTVLMIGVERGKLAFDNGIEYIKAFGSNVVTVGKWFGENWHTVLQDMGNVTTTALSNIGANLGDFYQAVQNWLSGKGFNFEFTSLTEGFEPVTKELPKLAEAATKTTNSKIEDLNAQLEEREIARANRIANAARKAAEEKAAAEAKAAEKAAAAASKAEPPTSKPENDDVSNEIKKQNKLTAITAAGQKERDKIEAATISSAEAIFNRQVKPSDKIPTPQPTKQSAFVQIASTSERQHRQQERKQKLSDQDRPARKSGVQLQQERQQKRNQRLQALDNRSKLTRAATIASSSPLAKMMETAIQKAAANIHSFGQGRGRTLPAQNGPPTPQDVPRNAPPLPSSLSGGSAGGNPKEIVDEVSKNVDASNSIIEQLRTLNATVKSGGSRGARLA